MEISKNSRRSRRTSKRSRYLTYYNNKKLHHFNVLKFLPFSAAETTVVKAQVHAGGRGKGHFNNGFKGGVKLCQTFVSRKHFQKFLVY